MNKEPPSRDTEQLLSTICREVRYLSAKIEGLASRQQSMEVIQFVILLIVGGVFGLVSYMAFGA